MTSVDSKRSPSKRTSEITSYDSKRRIEQVFNEKFSSYSSGGSLFPSTCYFLLCFFANAAAKLFDFFRNNASRTVFQPIQISSNHEVIPMIGQGYRETGPGDNSKPTKSIIM